MSKWLCGGCGRIADKEIRHGTGQADFCGYEIQCGPWQDVTHVYRAGQEEIRERAAKACLLDGVVSHTGNPCTYLVDAAEHIRALPLEGHDE